MKLSISNIAWTKEKDLYMYSKLKEMGFAGIEIAPTRIIETDPYMNIFKIMEWKESVLNLYGLKVSSMQSIWFGRKENMFVSNEDRKTLFEYTQRAIDFADAINCHNLVFGCPRNRIFPKGGDSKIAIDFFKAIGDYAYNHNTVIALEANPKIYNTNYINTTSEAIQLIKTVSSKGFKLNLDIGTIIENDEDISILKGNENLINHVHVSEPRLELIKKRKIHKEISDFLKKSAYNKYVSIEVRLIEDDSLLIDTMEYICKVFG